jgi:hypothetical protein
MPRPDSDPGIGLGKHVNADLTLHFQGRHDGRVLDLPQLF